MDEKAQEEMNKAIVFLIIKELKLNERKSTAEEIFKELDECHAVYGMDGYNNVKKKFGVE